MTKDFDPITESPLQTGQDGEGNVSQQKCFRKKRSKYFVSCLYSSYLTDSSNVKTVKMFEKSFAWLIRPCLKVIFKRFFTGGDGKGTPIDN